MALGAYLLEKNLLQVILQAYSKLGVCMNNRIAQRQNNGVVHGLGLLIPRKIFNKPDN